MMSGAVDALIPVKDFALAKERLGPLLLPAQRAELARAMFTDVLEALGGSGAIRRMWVVTGSAEVLEGAALFGAAGIEEPHHLGGLNAALEHARARIIRVDAPSALLVLPGDVPGETPAAIRRLVSIQGTGPLVRICAAGDRGTNALLLRPPDAIPFRYGPRSADRHLSEARGRALPCETVVVPEFITDLDTPADVREWLAAGPSGHTAELLKRLLPVRDAPA